MKTLYLNPLYLFGYAFLAVIILYSLGLSALYKNGSTLLTLIMITLCLFSLFFGLVFGSVFRKNLKVDISDESYDKILWPNALFIILGFAIDCIASGTIPLLSILGGVDYSYKDFGLKTFHVFYMGYMSAFSIICFERFLSTKNKKFLWYSMLGIGVTILIVSRGAVLLLLIPMVLLYLSQKKVEKKNGFKKFSLIVVCLFSSILVFGYLGDKRMVASGYKDENAIMNIGQADDVFYTIPSGFFWVYLYASSPYGTLAAQEKFNNFDRGEIDDFVASSLMPDFISKYVAPNASSKFSPKRLTPELTVGTGFSTAIVTIGYSGIILLFLWMVTLSFLFAWFNRHKYINSTCAILSAASVLMTFDNMFIFSSCVMQLLIITVFSRVKFGRYHFI